VGGEATYANIERCDLKALPDYKDRIRRGGQKQLIPLLTERIQNEYNTDNQSLLKYHLCSAR